MSQVTLAPGPESNRISGASISDQNSSPQSKISHISPRIAQDIVMFIEFSIILLTSVIAKIGYLDIYSGANDGFTRYLLPTFAAAILVCYIFAKRKLYDQSVLTDSTRAIPAIISSVILALLILIAIGYAAKYVHAYSRGWMLSWGLLATTSLLIERAAVSWIYHKAIKHGLFCRRIAILGSGPMAKRLREHILMSSSGVRLVGVFDDIPYDQAETLRAAVKVDGSTGELIQIGQQNKIDEVIIAAPGSSDTHILHAAEKLQILPVDVTVCPSEVTQKLAIQDVSRFSDLTLLKVQRRPINDWGNFAKSMFDVAVAGFALIALSPILLIVALGIKLGSPGPILFRQQRHGYNHKVFDVLKFRTMTVMDKGDGVVVQAKQDDARVTPLGRFLRRSSIDELPQLINVLKGDMSLVGPRPHALTHNDYYAEMLEQYANRHRVKPGITGLAQIRGFRGPTETLDKMRARVDADLEYIDTWSFWLDLRILFTTFYTVIVGKNAF